MARAAKAKRPTSLREAIDNADSLAEARALKRIYETPARRSRPKAKGRGA